MGCTELTESDSIIESRQSQYGDSTTVPDDIALSPEQTPVQPANVAFLLTYFSGKRRSFNPAWFASYTWLEYSVKNDACYCYPCRVFGSTGGGSSS